MAKVTKKQINFCLDNINTLRTRYRLPGETGLFNNSMQTFRCAYVDAEDGFTTIYAYGDALSFKHYYGENCYDVSDIIMDWIAGEIERRDVVNKIHDILRNGIEEEVY